MKNLHPGMVLFALLLVAVAASGWFYGIHWKKVAAGEKFSPIEEQLILFQNQVDLLTEENDRLNKEIDKLISGKKSGKDRQ